VVVLFVALLIERELATGGLVVEERLGLALVEVGVHGVPRRGEYWALSFRL
jgi:hypothetical protein